MPISEFLLIGKITNEEQWRATLVTMKYILPSIFNYCTSKPVSPAPLKKKKKGFLFFFFFSHSLGLPLSSHPTKLSDWIINPVTGSRMHLTTKNSWDTVKRDTFCTSWICCLISTPHPCQPENERSNLNWWFISVQLSHRLSSHIVFIFPLRALLSKLCHPLMSMGCRRLAWMRTAACSPWNKRSRLRSAEWSVLPDSHGIALAIGKSKPACLCWDAHRRTATKCIKLRLAAVALVTKGLGPRSAPFQYGSCHQNTFSFN